MLHEIELFETKPHSLSVPLSLFAFPTLLLSVMRFMRVEGASEKEQMESKVSPLALGGAAGTAASRDLLVSHSFLRRPARLPLGPQNQ